MGTERVDAVRPLDARTGTTGGTRKSEHGSGGVTPELLAVRLGRVVLRVRRRMRWNSPAELTVGQVSMLATVVRRGPVGIRQLAEAEALPSPAVTRLVDKLEAEGLVVRQANPGDRRAVLVAATPAGAAAFAKHERAADAWLAGRLRLLDADQLGELERAVALLEALAGDGDEAGA